MNIAYKRPAPSVTLVLVCYNQEKYIKEAVFSALNQDYTPLKIIISDDCSSDKTVSIIEETLKSHSSKHEVIVNRNLTNQGLIQHINIVNKLVDTELLVIAAGDDISHQNRVSKTIEAYRLAEQQPTSIYSSVRCISDNDELGDIWSPPIRETGHSILNCALKGGLIIGASHAWHKSLFTTFGDITEKGAYEDLVLAYRSAILGGLVYIDEPLVYYRHGVGISHIKKENVPKKIANRNKLAYVNKHMIPVLKQRLIDSEHISNKTVKIQTQKIIAKEINKFQIIDAFLERHKIIKIYRLAKKHANLIFFARYLRKRIFNKI